MGGGRDPDGWSLGKLWARLGRMDIWQMLMFSNLLQQARGGHSTVHTVRSHRVFHTVPSHQVLGGGRRRGMGYGGMGMGRGFGMRRGMYY